MNNSFLFELGLEEMPAHAVQPAMQQLHDRMVEFLAKYHLTYDSIDLFSTPRRLAFRVNNLIDKQPDLTEEVKGPSLKVAKDADGNWSKAAIGFTRGQGLSVDDIYIKELNGEEYTFVTKEIKGKLTLDILPLMIDEVIKKMTFKTMMHWGEYSFEFIRPIRWIVALYGEMLVPMEILDIESGAISQGHRTLGKPVVITRPEMYEALLQSQFVIVDPFIRQTKIMEQIIEFATKNQWKIDLDAELLEEVTNLVEFPTAFVGVFDEKYLQIPKPVLTTSMKDHQRYFYVTDAKGSLLPYFVSVRNGHLENITTVIEGNEKVLKARLEDAEFFYQEDQKHSIADDVEKLQNVTFHEKIGTMTEKMQRVKIISKYLATQFGLDVAEMEDLLRVSAIYKFDLVTGMVGEFPELQGVMGEIYALLFGENERVAEAIREHYLPISAEGELPETKVGAILAIADKLDSLMSFFSVGLIPNGSNDPYALRRQAYGIIRILEQFKWHLPITAMQEEIAKLANAESSFKYDYDFELLTNFFADRMRQWLQLKEIHHDIIEAVLNSTEESVENVLAAAQVLEKHREDEDYKLATESLSRIQRLVKKQEITNTVIDPQLFENNAEKVLYQEIKTLSDELMQLGIEDRYLRLKELQPAINRYFDETMIMVEDEKVKNNRLAQLAQINQIIMQIADMDQLVIK